MSRLPTAKFLPDKRQNKILPSGNFLFPIGRYHLYKQNVTGLPLPQTYTVTCRGYSVNAPPPRCLTACRLAAQPAPPQKNNLQRTKKKKAARTNAIITPQEPAKKNRPRASAEPPRSELQRKTARAQNAAARTQCWSGGRGLGREENNASEEEGLLPPQKNNLQRTKKKKAARTNAITTPREPAKKNRPRASAEKIPMLWHIHI